MRLVIDTSILVAALRGRATQVRSRIMQYSPDSIVVPYQVEAELRVGAAKSARPEFHNQQVSAILNPFAVVWPDRMALEHYVDIRVTLERGGNQIGEADLWIAALARSMGGVLVTHNTGEFCRVPGLALDDWLI